MVDEIPLVPSDHPTLNAKRGGSVMSFYSASPNPTSGKRIRNADTIVLNLISSITSGVLVTMESLFSSGSTSIR